MRSTRGDIIDQALQRVGNTTATLKNAARFRLNRILQELYQGFDWPFLFTKVPIVIPPTGTIQMPADFVKAEDDQALFVEQTQGVAMPGPVQEVDHRAFERYRGTVGYTQQSTRPRIWTLDYGSMTGMSFPTPIEQCFCSFRYKFLPLDFPLDDPAAYDADIPFFPWDTTLSDLLFEWAMSYEVDQRRGDQYQVNIESVLRSRGATYPERSFPSTVPLDPVFFSTPTWGYGRGRP